MCAGLGGGPCCPCHLTSERQGAFTVSELVAPLGSTPAGVPSALWGVARRMCGLGGQGGSAGRQEPAGGPLAGSGAPPGLQSPCPAATEPVRLPT